MTKTKHDNNVTDRIGLAYAETETEILATIQPSVICNENRIGQQHDRSYRCGGVYAKNDTKLSRPIGPSVDCDKNQIR